MRVLLIFPACLFLAACAVPGSHTGPVVPEADAEVRAAADFADAPQVEIESVAETQVCRREITLGTRISRIRCEQEVEQAMQDLNEFQTREEIQYSRDQAMREELQRMERAVTNPEELGGRR